MPLRPLLALAAAGLLAGLALRTAPAGALELHTPHCLYGCPTGTLAAGTDVIVRPDYTLASNDETKFADWVAYRVHPDMFGGGRPRDWAPDPLLAAHETLEPDDYRDAHATLKTDRGHMAPLATFGGTELWFSVNYLSNIAPQSSELNQGPWRELEDAIRNASAIDPQLEIYVVTGAAYGGHFEELPAADEPHRVPTAYWKVVAAQTEDGEGRPQIEVTAFLMDQGIAREAAYCDSMVDLFRIQTVSGMAFFHGLDARPDIRLVDRSALMRGALGCAES
jgi:endonuclease G